MKIRKQKSSDKLWHDEKGQGIPYERNTKYERASEITSYRLAHEAAKINKQLIAFKEKLRDDVAKLYELFTAENGVIGQGKGTATFFNFDRSIKVAVKVNEQITFDDNTIALAKEKLDLFLTEGLDGAKDFVKPLVMEAFHQRNGNLDTKRVLGLKTHAHRIDHQLYSEAMKLIDKSVRRPTTKEYFQVWVKDEKGEYKDIQLNFASV